MFWLIFIFVQVAISSLYEIDSSKLYTGSIKGYLRIEQAQQLISNWTTKYPQLVVPSFEIGKTYLNNSIKMTGITKIQNKNPENLKKSPGILLTSLFHPRQRGSLTMLLATFLQVLSLANQSDQINYLLETSVVWFVPFVNLDGIMYIQKLWDDGYKLLDRNVEFRKNRNATGSTCKFQIEVGVDLNRNFDVEFGGLMINNRCSEEYPGEFAFSERQTQAIQMVFKQYALTLIIDIHEYGNNWIQPFSYDKSGKAVNDNQTHANFYNMVRNYLKTKNQSLQNCYQSLGYIADGVYIDWALKNNVFSLAFEVGHNFSQPIEALQQSINDKMPEMTFMILRNSYNVEPICQKNLTEVKEITLQSNSLVDLVVEVQGLLYWKSGSKMIKDRLVKISPLGQVIIGFKPSQQKAIIQFTVKHPPLKPQFSESKILQPHKIIKQSIYTQQIQFPKNLPTCTNLQIGIKIFVIICVFLMIIGVVVTVLRTQVPGEQMRNYEIVQQPESTEAV